MVTVWNKEYSKGDTFGINPDATTIEIANRLPMGSRVLDYGCGQGRNAVYLAKRGLFVVGFDLAEEGVRRTRSYAKELGVSDKVRVFVSDGLSPAIDPRLMFNGVICIYVFDYISPFPEPIDTERTNRVLNHIKQIVLPGGYVGISFARIHTFPETEKRIDREYSEDRLGEAFSDWEDVELDANWGGERQTPWGVKNNFDVRLIARKPAK